MFQESGTWRGSDIAAAATIVTRSTRRVHMSASRLNLSNYYLTHAGKAKMPADSCRCVGLGWRLRRTKPYLPDWPWVLLTAAAPVPDFSRQSLGISFRFGYFDASQRPSFWATCFDFSLDLSLSNGIGSDAVVVVVVAPMPGLPVAEVDPFIDAEVELFAPTLALGFDVLSLLVDGVVGAV